MHVLLDLWGTLLDSTRMHEAFGPRMAGILAARIGGDPGAWRRAYDAAWPWYSARAAATDWTRGDYLEEVGRLDGEYVERILKGAGASWRPADAASFWAEVEGAVMASVDARFPDTRPALEKLRAAGHRVVVVTSATDSNARGSLAGAGCLDLLDDVFSGTRVNRHKSTVDYWGRVLGGMHAPPEASFVVDDRLVYLEAAAKAGIPAVLLDRMSAHPPDGLPSFVRATLRNLAGLPHLADLIERGEAP
ncbi:MAG: hypothetical protein A3K59_05145 [Euryarchaeota archaeon RBG_19FT_COMBO_69_17]|nr:MAG: hypothetical protein A3K59_05145 [Euryarchaeota archaeon RBG_19FT_COMBO_69_17]